MATGLSSTRRGFVASCGVAASIVSLPPATALAADGSERAVHLWGDGLGLSPRAHAALLDRLCAKADVAEDVYLLGGEVERFERRWARLLGKEAAVFMPSGTLANQLALRALAGSKRRVVVPEVSHIYNDTGDACQTLSGLTLMPLGAGAATFTRADVEAVLARTESGRVAAQVGAIAIETPIRRLAGRMFDHDALKRVSALARERGIAMHLDGARLFIASAYAGIAPAEVASHFDTVYVSLWKCFNSGLGAILAGPARVLDGMHHARRMFGGNLASGWHAALLAGHFMDGFDARLKSAIAVSEAFYAALARHPKASVERVPNGTNLAHVRLEGIDVATLGERLAQRGISMPGAEPGSRTVTLWVNETWNRTTAAELVRAFEQAIG